MIEIKDISSELIEAMEIATQYQRVKRVRALKIGAVSNSRYATVMLNGVECEIDLIDFMVAGVSFIPGNYIVADDCGKLNIVDEDYIERFNIVI